MAAVKCLIGAREDWHPLALVAHLMLASPTERHAVGADVMDDHDEVLATLAWVSRELDARDTDDDAATQPQRQGRRVLQTARRGDPQACEFNAHDTPQNELQHVITSNLKKKKKKMMMKKKKKKKRQEGEEENCRGSF